MKRTIRLTENELRNLIAESVKRVLNEAEYGNTPQGNFAVNAVRGRRAAQRYYTNMNGKERAENDRVMNSAGDKLFRNYKENPDLGFDNEAGYYYGFQKGLEKYRK